jgi:hypothetical protein
MWEVEVVQVLGIEGSMLQLFFELKQFSMV